MHASNTTLREPAMLRIALVLITVSLCGATTNASVYATGEEGREGCLGDGII
jgi:hypothetical protein